MVIGLIGSYAYSRTKEFVAGPSIVISSPQDGAVLDNTFVELKGIAQNISRISLNGRQIFTDEAGAFNEALLLYPGYNIINVYAEDRFERMVKKSARLMVVAPEKIQVEIPETIEELEEEGES